MIINNQHGFLNQKHIEIINVQLNTLKNSPIKSVILFILYLFQLKNLDLLKKHSQICYRFPWFFKSNKWCVN